MRWEEEQQKGQEKREEQQVVKILEECEHLTNNRNKNKTKRHLEKAWVEKQEMNQVDKESLKVQGRVFQN